MECSSRDCNRECLTDLHLELQQILAFRFGETDSDPQSCNSETYHVDPMRPSRAAATIPQLASFHSLVTRLIPGPLVAVSTAICLHVCSIATGDTNAPGVTGRCGVPAQRPRRQRVERALRVAATTCSVPATLHHAGPARAGRRSDGTKLPPSLRWPVKAGKLQRS